MVFARVSRSTACPKELEGLGCRIAAAAPAGADSETVAIRMVATTATAVLAWTACAFYRYTTAGRTTMSCDSFEPHVGAVAAGASLNKVVPRQARHRQREPSR